MREMPILFSGEMVRAILSGRKTQTRRVIKPQPEIHQEYGIISDYETFEWEWRGKIKEDIGCPADMIKHCPYGQPGDLLWVRETWGFSAKLPASTKDEWAWLAYPELRGYRADNHVDGYCWRPSIFMPRWASRITLKITNVRVERLQLISDKDAIAEGVSLSYSTGIAKEAKWHFERLWDTINAKRGYSWASNPWVWVIEFCKI